MTSDIERSRFILHCGAFKSNLPVAGFSKLSKDITKEVIESEDPMEIMNSLATIGHVDAGANPNFPMMYPAIEYVLRVPSEGSDSGEDSWSLLVERPITDEHYPVTNRVGDFYRRSRLI